LRPPKRDFLLQSQKIEHPDTKGQGILEEAKVMQGKGSYLTPSLWEKFFYVEAIIFGPIS
jgi:hypothetical protein